MVHEDEICEKCGNLNSLINSICCTCHWHNGEHRVSSLEEMKEVESALDEAASNLNY